MLQLYVTLGPISISCCDNTTIIVWLGLGIGKDNAFA